MIIEIPHSYSSLFTRQVATKKDDLGTFMVPYTIGACNFGRDLCKLGASVNLMPQMVFYQVGKNTLVQITMKLHMSNRSIKRPIRILYDLLVRVNKFIFPADFISLYCDLNIDVPIILG